MRKQQTSLSEMVKQLGLIIENEDTLECELKECAGGVVFSGDRASLLYIAQRMIGLANSGISGSHFTIDKADITPDAEIELTIARKDFNQ